LYTGLGMNFESQKNVFRFTATRSFVPILPCSIFERILFCRIWLCFQYTACSTLS
jgi:hypothetical protein